MFWLILIVVTGVITLLVLGSFGWRVFVAARELMGEVAKTSKVIAEAKETLNGIAEMDGVKAVRSRTQHD